MERRTDLPEDMPPTHGLGIPQLWRRIVAAQQSERREKVGFWLGLLLLVVPIFYFLLFFKRYSKWARLGWGLWLGFIVFVKIFGLSDAVVHIETPSEGTAAVTADPSEVPLKTYLGRLLGAQYMDWYRIDGDKLVITYEQHDGYFGSESVLGDLAVSNGYSLLFRRDISDLTFRFPVGTTWKESHMTRQQYREFFGLTEQAMQSFLDPEKLKQSPIYNISSADKTRFTRQFVREIPPPTDPRPIEPKADPRSLLDAAGKK